MHRLLFTALIFFTFFFQAFSQENIKVKKFEKTVYLGTYKFSEHRLIPPDQMSLQKTVQDDTLFDNTESQGTFIDVSAVAALPQEVIDWGTITGGTVTSFQIGYVTSLTQGEQTREAGGEKTQRVLIDVHMRWDTDYDSDGSVQRTFPLSLQFSPDGTPTAYVVDVDISNDPLTLPAGRIGYGYQFLSPSLQSGPATATGGKGATKLFRIKPFSEENLRFTTGTFGQFHFQLRGTLDNLSDSAKDDTYFGIGNVGLTVDSQHGLLINDAGADTTEPSDRSTEQGGIVTVESQGGFTYNPPLGFTGTDRFTYILRDDQSNVSCAEVEIKYDSLIWFIDNNDDGKNVGSFNNPFQSLSDFENPPQTQAGPGENDIIFLYSSVSDYESGLSLQNGQRVFGQGINFVQALGDLGITLEEYNDLTRNSPAQGNSPVIISSTGSGIDLADNNTIRGLDIGATLDYGIRGSGSGSLTIDGVNISGTGGGVNLNGYDLDVTFGSISSNNANEHGINLDNVSGSFTLGDTVAVTNAEGVGVRIENSDLQFRLSASYKYNGKFGISLTNNTGAFEFADVDITTTDSTGMFADSSGAIKVDGGSINSTNGIALKLKHSNLDMTFDSISSDGGRFGIFLKNTTGSLSINGGTIQNTGLDGIRSRNAEGVRLQGIDILNSGRHSLARIGTRFDLDARNLTIDGSVNEGVFGQLSLKSEYENSPGNTGLQKVTAVRQTTNKFILKDSEVSNTGADGVKVQIGGTDSAEVTISGNTITTSSDFGLTVQTSDSGFALVELSNNASSGATSDFNLVQDSTSTFALKGFTGGDSSAVVSYIQDNNTGTPTVTVTGNIRAETTTSVSGPGQSVVPTEFALEQNYPNPFNPSTTIQFALPRQSKVSLKLFDLLGREISTLVNEELKTGRYKFTFEANDLPTGIYFYRLQTDGFVETKKLTLLK